jgi:phosphoribosylaminoimidazole-succinocarboxamide synthase
MPTSSLFESNLPSLELIQRGKVRDLYNIDDKHMLIITTDRISAFDVILPNPIPSKGEVLTSVSNFWFNFIKDIIPNHLTKMKLSDILPNDKEREQVAGRAIIVKKLRPLPVEAIVRGYIIGSGWKDYNKTGAICGISLPNNLKLAERLQQPIYTPSTKAEIGAHDENVDYQHTVNLLGKELAEKVRNISLQIYTKARNYAVEHEIIIADTKFEFGLDDNDELIIIDEVLTPDSSRFWPTEQYQAGQNPSSFDKQFVRDYLETLDWNKTAPAPELPQHIIEKTAAKYNEAKQKLTGKV